MRIIGIDPGLEGGIALLTPATGALEVWEIPTVTVTVGRKATKKRFDHAGLAAILAPLAAPGVTAFLEEVNAMPSMPGKGGQRRQMGATSAFAFGKTAGALEQALASAGIPYTLVTPSVWKSAVGLRGKAGDKGASINRAGQLMPRHVGLWRGPKGGARDGLAEASLIAHYGAETLRLNAVTEAAE